MVPLPPSLSNRLFSSLLSQPGINDEEPAEREVKRRVKGSEDHPSIVSASLSFSFTGRRAINGRPVKEKEREVYPRRGLLVNSSPTKGKELTLGYY